MADQKMSHFETCGICHTAGFCEHRIPKVSKEELERAIAEGIKNLKITTPAERERDRMEAKKPQARLGRCWVCGGIVTEEFRIQYEPITMHTPIGGPPRSGWWVTTGLGCQNCGIAYKDIKEPKK